MSFWLVQIISVVGVAAVIALTWLVGWGRRARIASVEDAAARFAADFPAAEVKEGVVAKDKRAALLELGDGLGLVTVLGDELVTRRLRASEFVLQTQGQDLVLRLSDPTLHSVLLPLTENGLEIWRKKLSSPACGGGEPRSGGGGSHEHGASGSPLRRSATPPPQAGEERVVS